jgi:hypothetical protein
VEKPQAHAHRGRAALQRRVKSRLYNLGFSPCGRGCLQAPLFPLPPRLSNIVALQAPPTEADGSPSNLGGPKSTPPFVVTMHASAESNCPGAFSAIDPVAASAYDLVEFTGRSSTEKPATHRGINKYQKYAICRPLCSVCPDRSAGLPDPGGRCLPKRAQASLASASRNRTFSAPRNTSGRSGLCADGSSR